MSIYTEIKSAVLEFETREGIKVMLIRLCNEHQLELNKWKNQDKDIVAITVVGRTVVHEMLNNSERCIVCEEL